MGRHPHPMVDLGPVALAGKLRVRRRWAAPHRRTRSRALCHPSGGTEPVRDSLPAPAELPHVQPTVGDAVELAPGRHIDGHRVRGPDYVSSRVIDHGNESDLTAAFKRDPPAGTRLPRQDWGCDGLPECAGAAWVLLPCLDYDICRRPSAELMTGKPAFGRQPSRRRRPLSSTPAGRALPSTLA